MLVILVDVVEVCGEEVERVWWGVCPLSQLLTQLWCRSEWCCSGGGGVGV